MSTPLKTDTDPADNAPHHAKEAPANYVAITDNAVSIMVERIVRRFEPLRIILFGSRARGDLVGDVLRPALAEGKVLYERG